eukprot:Gb_35165 [translate_table: standard]
MALNVLAISVLLGLCIGIAGIGSAALSVNYYDKSCPRAEQVVRDALLNATQLDPKVPPRILRMHFHDCFVRGCDGSVLLDSTPHNKAEKKGQPNQSLGAFYVIDNAKTMLESICPKTVSCADILAIAARDVVALSGGPKWEVEKGRMDGRISKANETNSLPTPNFNISQLIQSFALRGLSTHDLVALSGGHTLGFSHCSSFQQRLHNFSVTHEMDPSMERVFVEKLKKQCPVGNINSSAGAFMDSTTKQFDNQYFKHLVGGKGLFTSDHALLLDNRTKSLVEVFAGDENSFFKAFAKSMVKMGAIQGAHGGEVRLNCRKVNS